MPTYLLGILSALAAGVAFNLGLVLQKVAVARVPKETPHLMRHVVQSPLWLVGFGLQFLFGTPLNMLALGHLGPAIVPGLMSMGLIVLALAGMLIARESVRLEDVAGIILVMIAVTLFGLSGLTVDMKGVDLRDPVLFMRFIIFTTAVASLSILCHTLKGSMKRHEGILHILNAGLLYVQSNLWLAFLMGHLMRWSSGSLSHSELTFMGLASLVIFTASIFGIAETQRAFRSGDAVRLVPIQNLPQQVLPLVSYFTVFALSPPRPSSLPLGGTGALLIIVGSGLLARRQMELQSIEGGTT
ncbi:hypothetical protein [Spirochaeta thermophila]|uniref:Uncharacterized protein n=1 Tax=Winmispira thermophila (strain ATCC 49972 / DSM 6192 / RI 19.B1) TaxID=665571 RepID=E0RTV8_WINT6|nr:hypothetical protein [Spirochaeta thermophila]ADN02483.1 hypothetical protein STHERM_c15430 [Spirochaeta thermophila DSM 6192]